MWPHGRYSFHRVLRAFMWPQKSGPTRLAGPLSVYGSLLVHLGHAGLCINVDRLALIVVINNLDLPNRSSVILAQVGLGGLAGDDFNGALNGFLQRDLRSRDELLVGFEQCPGRSRGEHQDYEAGNYDS